MTDEALKAELICWGIAILITVPLIIYQFVERRACNKAGGTYIYSEMRCLTGFKEIDP